MNIVKNYHFLKLVLLKQLFIQHFYNKFMQQDRFKHLQHDKQTQKIFGSHQTRYQSEKSSIKQTQKIKKQTFRFFGITIRKNFQFFKNTNVSIFCQTIILKTNRILYNFMLIHSTDRLPNNRNFRNIYSTNIMYNESNDDVVQQWPFIQDDQINFSKQMSHKDKFCLMFSLKEPGKQDQQQYQTAIDRQFQINLSKQLKGDDNITIQIEVQGQESDRKVKCEIKYNKDSQKQQQMAIFYDEVDHSDIFNIYLKRENKILLNDQLQTLFANLFSQFSPPIGTAQKQFQIKQIHNQKEHKTIITKKTLQISVNNAQDPYSFNELKKLLNFIIYSNRSTGFATGVAFSDSALYDYQLYTKMYRNTISQDTYQKNPSLAHHLSNRIFNPHFLRTGLMKDYYPVKDHLKSIKAPQNEQKNITGLPCYLLQGELGDCSIIAVQNQIIMVQGSYYEKIVPFESDSPSYIGMNLNLDGQIICLTSDTGIPRRGITKSQPEGRLSKFLNFFKNLLQDFNKIQNFMSVSHQYKSYKKPQLYLLQKRIEKAILFESILAQYYSSFLKLRGSHPQQTFMNITNTPSKSYQISIQSDFSILKNKFKRWKDNFIGTQTSKKILITISISDLTNKIKNKDHSLKQWNYRKLKELGCHTYSFCGYYEDQQLNFTPFFILSKSHQNSAIQWRKHQHKNINSQYSKNFNKWVNHLKQFSDIDYKEYLNNDQFLVQLSFLKDVEAVANVCQINLQDKYYSKQMIMYDGWYNQILFYASNQEQYTIIFHRPNARNGVTIQQKKMKKIQDEVTDQLVQYNYTYCSMILYHIDSKQTFQQHGCMDQMITVLNHTKFHGHYRLLIGQIKSRQNAIDEIFYDEEKKARVCVLSISGPSIDKSYYKFSLKHKVSQIQPYINLTTRKISFSTIEQHSKPKKFIFTTQYDYKFFAFIFQGKAKTAQDPNDLVQIQIQLQNRFIPDNSDGKIKTKQLFNPNKFRSNFPIYFPRQIKRHDSFIITMGLKPLFFERQISKLSQVFIYFIKFNTVEEFRHYIHEKQHH